MNKAITLESVYTGLTSNLTCSGLTRPWVSPMITAVHLLPSIIFDIF